MSSSLRPHGLQHASLPCPSLSLGVCSNSCPLSRWCHPTISSTVKEYLILSVYHYLSFLTLGFWVGSHFFHFINSTVNILVVFSYIPVRITLKSHLSECSTLKFNSKSFYKGKVKIYTPTSDIWVPIDLPPLWSLLDFINFASILNVKEPLLVDNSFFLSVKSLYMTFIHFSRGLSFLGWFVGFLSAIWVADNLQSVAYIFIFFMISCDEW